MNLTTVLVIIAAVLLLYYAVYGEKPQDVIKRVMKGGK